MNLSRAIFPVFTTIVLAFSIHAASLTFPEPNDLPVQTNLPDVMTMADGTRVTTPEQWQQRREEMKAILEHYELGHAPPPPGNVTGKDIKSANFLDGTVKYRLVHLKFGPEKKLGMDIAIFTPAGQGPFPTIINPSFFMTPGVNFTNNTKSITPPPTNFLARLRMPVDPAQAAMNFTNI